MAEVNVERMYKVIRCQVVSEKSARLGELDNQYVFDVDRSATKSEVREAIEKLFSVRVLSVQILNRKGKAKRFGRINGRQSNKRRAFVRLHRDDEISFLEGVKQ